MVEWVKENILRWFGHGQRMEFYYEFAKVYLSSVEGSSRRGRPLGKWEDGVKEYLSERGVRGNGLERARRKCMDRGRWRSFCHGHPLGDASGGSEALEQLID